MKYECSPPTLILNKLVETNLHGLISYVKLPWCPHADICLEKLYIMAFTSGLENAESDTSHSIEVQIINGDVHRIQLYDRPGDDYAFYKGDLWKIAFYFTVECIRLSEIQRVSIIESGNDNWNIDSIITLVRDSANRSVVLTQDINVNCWIDSNGADSFRHFELTFATISDNAGK